MGRSKTLSAVLLTVTLATPVLADTKPPDYGVYDPLGDYTTSDLVKIEHLFLPWEDLFLESLIEADAYALERGRDVLVTIEPWTWTRDARNTPEALIRGINDGTYDDNMSSICGELNKFESKVTVRWAQEMDFSEGQFIWSGWEPETYIDAFKRVIDLCRAAAPEVAVMWSPLGDDGMEDFYPGDDYVDVVGVSVFGYQPWEERILGTSRTFHDIFAPRYENARQFGKPVVVAELGFSGVQEYVDLWQNDIEQPMPQYPTLESVVYFNQQEVHPWPDGFGLPNWRIGDRVIVRSAEAQQ
ncbi:glycoside hydrolase family 26 protein [Aliiroseovarius crassostreae]|uniref:glycoside hydrolase family 26 protein n=1 Tax=Aliiroseovarius crassostreae TaxID=154981 RepID=UPI003C7EC22D